MDLVKERGVALVNTTVDYDRNLQNKYFDEMKRVLEKMNVQVHEFHFADLADPRARERILQAFSTMVVSGNGGHGPHFLDDDEFSKRYAFMIKFAGKGLFVCRAMQSYLLQSGAKFATDQIPERGAVETTVIDPHHPLMQGVGKNFLIHADHVQRIDEASLPKGFSVIASSPNCTVSVVQAPQKNHLLTQNHPEYYELTAKKLVDNFLH